MQNYHDIYLDIDDGGHLHNMLAEKLKNPKKIDDYRFLSFPSIIKMMGNRSSLALKHQLVQDLMYSGQKFDLVILGWFFNDFQLGLAGHFQCPSVIVSILPAMKLMRDFVGNPSGIESVGPLNKGPSKEPMTFFGRVGNFLFYVFEYFVGEIVDRFFNEPYYDANFPASKNYPTYEEVKKNVSLVLLNHHFSQGSVRAYVPNMIEVSGMHIKNKPDPLPKVVSKLYFLLCYILVN